MPVVNLPEEPKMVKKVEREIVPPQSMQPNSDLDQIEAQLKEIESKLSAFQ